MGLDVGVVCAEEFLGAVYGELFYDVDEFAAAVVAPSGVALGVFVGEDGPLGLEDCAAGVVFGRDEVDVLALPSYFALDGVGYAGVAVVEGGHLGLRG